MSWTHERIEVLRHLWEYEGKSDAEIAVILGSEFTRNSVLAKRHRLKIRERITPRDTTSATRSKPFRRPPGFSESAPAVPQAPIIPTATPSLSDKRSPERRVKIPDVLPKSEPILTVEASTLLPTSLRVTIVDLNESMCKWPLGDPTDFAKFRYCGSPVHGTGPYCQHHGKLAYQPAQERRRDRENERLHLSTR